MKTTLLLALLTSFFALSAAAQHCWGSLWADQHTDEGTRALYAALSYQRSSHTTAAKTTALGVRVVGIARLNDNMVLQDSFRYTYSGDRTSTYDYNMMVYERDSTPFDSCNYYSSQLGNLQQQYLHTAVYANTSTTVKDTTFYHPGPVAYFRLYNTTGKDSISFIQAQGINPPHIQNTYDYDANGRLSSVYSYANNLPRYRTDFYYNSMDDIDTAIVWNTLGQKVLAQPLTATRTTTIPIGHLSPGIYWIAAQGAEGVSEAISFIKQ